MSTQLATLTEPLATEWDELVARVRVAPFLRPGWFVAENARHIMLSHVDATGLEPWLRAEAHAAGRALVVTPVQRSPYLRLEGGWAAIQQRLGSKRAAELRRRRGILERAGRLNVRIADGAQDLPALLEEGF